MQNTPPEVLALLTGSQPQIWQTVSLTVSEAGNVEVNFEAPKTALVPLADLYAEMTVPKLVIQFSFADQPDNQQIVLLTQDALQSLGSQIKQEAVTTVDDSLVSEIRSSLEAIVQGICMAVGNIRNEAVVATGLSIRFQIPNLPPNLRSADEAVRVDLDLGGSAEGQATWLLDNAAAHAVIGATVNEDEAAPVVSGGSTRGQEAPGFDETGLEILMDIPLEISVELGRVRMLVKDIVELGTGSIVEIDKAAGEPVDVLVNGQLVARGEVVVIDDNFGVRITEILSPAERLAKLNEAA